MADECADGLAVRARRPFEPLADRVPLLLVAVEASLFAHDCPASTVRNQGYPRWKGAG